ncbi:MAG TPA: VWA domain-containing protein, partial [Vicinamibacterales bacterium]
MSFVSAQQQQQTFRTSTLLVEVDASVTDSKGQFVTGLTADDFEVLEEGKPQKIERLLVVTGGAVTTIPAPTAAVEDAGARPPAAPSTATQRVFVLVFDQEHLQEGAFKRLKDAAVAFLTKEFHQGDVGGIVIGATMIGSQLTSDREPLLAAVRNAKPSAAKTSRRLELYEWPRLSSEAEAIRIALVNDREVLAQAVRRACQDDPDACKNATPEPMVMEKARAIVNELRPAARRTVMTLQALASGLARLPGRKTVILMTEGFFVEESWADLRQIVGAAARSNVRIYSLDGRGLDTRQVNDMHLLSPLDPGGSIPLDAYNTTEDGPNMLAMDTGGYPIRHTNKFAEALTDIARDTSHYYVIGYSPASPATDGSFRRISVRVKRPGLTVRARRGYLATPAPVPTPAPTAAPAAALASPDVVRLKLDATDSSIAAPAPAAATAEPAAATATPNPTTSPPTAPSPAASAFTLRPDLSGRLRELASRGGGNGAAHDLASQGWERYQKGDLEGAADLLGKAAVDPSARPWVHYALGYSELGLRHLAQAAEAWERVRAATPEFRAVYLDLADAYMQMESYSRAIDALKAADARWPGDMDVLNAMGTIQVRRGALDDAIKTFRKATDARPDDALAYFNLGRTYELRYFKMRRYSPTEAR